MVCFSTDKESIVADKVIVGLSGGVDSAVAAYLLKQSGYEVEGAVMYQFDDAAFCDDAARVAECLDIKFHKVDMRDAFKQSVVDYFVEEYTKGRTPNPCTMCNPSVKFKMLIDVADRMGAKYIATGHYARVDELGGRFAVKNSKSALKDQTYALALLTQQQLSRVLMPLGDYEKEEVRRIAHELKLPVADAKDSQDICFIPEGDHGAFIRNILGSDGKSGNFIDTSGKILGHHDGIYKYTYGQRKGLGIAMGRPVFIQSINPLTGDIVLGENEDLMSCKCHVSSISLQGLSEEDLLTRKLWGKVRYAHKGTACSVTKTSNGYDVLFEEPVRAITPGQTLCLYFDEYVAAGAIID